MFGTLARVNFAHLNFNEARKGLRSNPLKDCVTPGSLRCFQPARPDNNLADLFADFDPFLCIVRYMMRSSLPAVEEAFTVAPEAKVLVIEGNYLLLGDPPWGAVKPTARSCSLYRRAREKVQNRLMKRHAEEGLFSEERNPNISTAWTCRTMILCEIQTKPRAARVINLVTERLNSLYLTKRKKS